MCSSVVNIRIKNDNIFFMKKVAMKVSFHFPARSCLNISSLYSARKEFMYNLFMTVVWNGLESVPKGLMSECMKNSIIVVVDKKKKKM